MSTAYQSAVGNPPVCTSAAFKTWLLAYLAWRFGEAPVARATSLYFAQAGNDSTGNGTSTTPYQTLAKAQSLMAPNTAFYFNAGDEWLNENITFSYSVSAGFSSSSTTQSATFLGILSTSDNWTLLTPGAQWAQTSGNTTLAASTINVTAINAAYFPAAGTLLINSAGVIWNVVTYTGVTTSGGNITAFTGCVGTPVTTFPVTITPMWAPQPLLGNYVQMTGGTTEYGIITALNTGTGVATITNPTGANFNGTTHTLINIWTPRGFVVASPNVTVAAYGTTGQRLPMFSAWGFRNGTEGGAASAYNFNNFTAPTAGVVVTTGTSTTQFTTPFQLAVGDAITVNTSANGTAAGTRTVVSAVTGPSGGVYTITVAALANAVATGDLFNSPFQWTWTLQGANVDKHQIAWIRDRDSVSGNYLYQQMQTPDQVEACAASGSGAWYQDSATSILYVSPHYRRGKQSTNIQPCYTNGQTGIAVQNVDGVRIHRMDVTGWGLSQNFTSFGSNVAGNQSERPYGIKTNVSGTNSTVITECEATFNYNHNIGHTTSLAGGFLLCVNNRWGWGMTGADTVGYAGPGAQETFIWGGYYLGGYLPQGIQPFSIIGSSTPTISHTAFNSSATGSTGVAISAYAGSGTTVGTFTCATWASVSGQNTVGSYVQMTGGTSEFVLVTAVNGTAITVQSVNGVNLQAGHTALSFGFWTAEVNLYVSYGVTNEVNPFSSNGFSSPGEVPSYYFPIFSGGATTSVFLTQDPPNSVYLPSPSLVPGEMLWAIGGTEEAVTVATYSSTTGALALAATNGTTHTAYVSLPRCRCFVLSCQQLGWRQDKRVQAIASYPITATSGADTTITFANSYQPAASLAPQAAQWVMLTGGAGLQPEWVQVKSYAAGVITLGDGTGFLRTTKVISAGRVTITYEQSMASTTVGRQQTCTYLGNPGSVCINCYNDVPLNASTWENLTFFSSPSNMWNGSTVDSSTTLHNGGGTTHIGCIFNFDASGAPPNAGVQGFAAVLTDATHNSQYRQYNCRNHFIVGPRTIATIDSAAGTGASPTANKIGMFNSILSADYQGLSNMTALTGGTEGGLSVGLGNVADQQGWNAYCNINLNSTLAAGVAGYTNDATGVLVPGCPPLWAAPAPGSPLIVANPTLIYGYALQYDYNWNVRANYTTASTPTAIGPIEQVTTVAVPTPAATGDLAKAVSDLVAQGGNAVDATRVLSLNLS